MVIREKDYFEAQFIPMGSPILPLLLALFTHTYRVHLLAEILRMIACNCYSVQLKYMHANGNIGPTLCIRLYNNRKMQ